MGYYSTSLGNLILKTEVLKLGQKKEEQKYMLERRVFYVFEQRPRLSEFRSLDDASRKLGLNQECTHICISSRYRPKKEI